MSSNGGARDAFTKCFPFLLSIEQVFDPLVVPMQHDRRSEFVRKLHAMIIINANLPRCMLCKSFEVSETWLLPRFPAGIFGVSCD
ncbi:hypothetical protein ALC60_05888 [Trachymyrmex zeteki]|uniref:Uncharacterized protein n=1 Tax=Mycetomoellerius zeteki TaxID=64791 RepID=A0A151X4B8_9HYME|nr:hypothetical protein ALC60_05888 [Trachymyrmex zeteki]